MAKFQIFLIKDKLRQITQDFSGDSGVEVSI